VRDDSGVYAGWEVPVYYDSLLAKLCVWSETRDSAIARLIRALDEYTIEGVNSTLPFFKAVAMNKEFREGSIDTGFIDRFWKAAGAEGQAPVTEAEPGLADIAAIAALLHIRAAGSRTEAAVLESGPSKWKMSGRLNQTKWRPLR
jgi:acetyl-CoA carboxylase biotin carboxylase subunit